MFDKLANEKIDETYDISKKIDFNNFFSGQKQFKKYY